MYVFLLATITLKFYNKLRHWKYETGLIQQAYQNNIADISEFLRNAFKELFCSIFIKRVLLIWRMRRCVNLFYIDIRRLVWVEMRQLSIQLQFVYYIYRSSTIYGFACRSICKISPDFTSCCIVFSCYNISFKRCSSCWLKSDWK